jgi:hypothetical protein
MFGVVATGWAELAFALCSRQINGSEKVHMAVRNVGTLFITFDVTLYGLRGVSQPCRATLQIRTPPIDRETPLCNMIVS